MYNVLKQNAHIVLHGLYRAIYSCHLHPTPSRPILLINQNRTTYQRRFGTPQKSQKKTIKICPQNINSLTAIPDETRHTHHTKIHPYTYTRHSYRDILAYNINITYVYTWCDTPNVDKRKSRHLVQLNKHQKERKARTGYRVSLASGVRRKQTPRQQAA